MKKVTKILLATSILAGSLTAIAKNDKLDATAMAKMTKNYNVKVLNTSEVFQGYYKVQDAQVKFNASVQNAQEQLQQMVAEGQGMMKEFQDFQAKANSDALTEEAKEKSKEEAEKKLQEIRKKEKDVNEFRQKKSVEMEESRRAIFEEYTRHIQNKATRLAEEQGIDYILDSSAVVYSRPALNITEAVLSSLNEGLPQPNIPVAPNQNFPALPHPDDVKKKL